MNFIDQALLKKISKTYDSPCLTILTPTHRHGEAVRQKMDLTLFRQQLHQARQRLAQHGMEDDAIDRLLAPAEEKLTDLDFWRHMSDGLVVMLGEGVSWIATVPVHFAELVYVADHYYVKPLTSLLHGDGRFFILALSRNHTRFFEGTRYSITDVKIDDLVPEGMEAAPVASGGEKSLQWRTTGGESSRFFGHGAGKDQSEAILKEYLRTIDQGLMKMLHDEHAPLVLACVDELAASYHAISQYSNLLSEHISGNPDDSDRLWLHEQAWEVVRPVFAEERRQAARTYKEKVHLSGTSDNPSGILRAAEEGRIAQLFTRNDANLWGNWKDRTLTLHENRSDDSICLLNLAAVRTLQFGGAVYNLPLEEMPAGSPAAAVFRA
jgi:hypothetical protein